MAGPDSHIDPALRPTASISSHVEAAPITPSTAFTITDAIASHRASHADTNILQPFPADPPRAAQGRPTITREQYTNASVGINTRCVSGGKTSGALPTRCDANTSLSDDANIRK